MSGPLLGWYVVGLVLVSALVAWITWSACELIFSLVVYRAARRAARHGLGGGVSARTTSSASLAAPREVSGASCPASTPHTSAATAPAEMQNQSSTQATRAIIAILDTGASTAWSAVRLALLSAGCLLARDNRSAISSLCSRIEVSPFTAMMLHITAAAAAVTISIIAVACWRNILTLTSHQEAGK